MPERQPLDIALIRKLYADEWDGLLDLILPLCDEVDRLSSDLREASNIALALFDRCGARVDAGEKCGQIATWLCWDAAGDHVYRCVHHRILRGGMLGDEDPRLLPAASNVEKIRSFLLETAPGVATERNT